MTVNVNTSKPSGESCRAYTDSDGLTYSEKSCPQFCCGNCISRYCCLDRSYKFGEDEQFMCNVLDDRYVTNSSVLGGNQLSPASQFGLGFNILILKFMEISYLLELEGTVKGH
uniref:Shisa N-terminal domain-containing protein n=1 Tax=Chelonoidis abingdonii TaxID=106734 RepID=A0A8C0ILZ0_CHEAB